jgi:hypothetical protein
MQLVSANQQVLTAAVNAYRAAYQKELTRLAALLRPPKAQPFRPGKQAGSGNLEHLAPVVFVGLQGSLCGQ